MLRMLCAVALLSSAACATRAARPVRIIPDRAMSELSAPATDFSTQSKPSADDEAKELRGRFEAALPAALRGKVRHDPRLDKVATVVGSTYAEEEQLPARTILRWLLWRAGVIGTPMATYVFFNEGGRDERAFNAELAKWAASLSSPEGLSLGYGVVRFETAGLKIQAMVAASRGVELESLPKQLQPGQPFTLRGKLLTEAASLHVDLDVDARSVRTVPVPLAADGSFSVDLVAPAAPGRAFLELSAIPGAGGGALGWRRSLLLTPLYVGVAEPSAPDDAIRTPAPNPPDLAQWVSTLVRAYDARRALVSLPPLRSAAPLETLVAGYAREAAAQRDTPPDPQLIERLNAAGLVTRNAFQHQFEFEFLDEAIWVNLLSPSFRAQLLDAGATLHAARFAPRPDGLYVMSEVLVSPVGQLDAAAQAQVLFAEVQRLRALRGKSGFAPEPKLEGAVRAYAAKVCAGELQRDDAEPLWALVRKSAFPGAVSVDAMVSAQLLPSDLSSGWDKLLDADFAHLAVATCQGTPPALGGQQLVLFLLGEGAKATPSKKR